MKMESVSVVRIYLTEDKAHLRRLMARLHDEERVRGVTVFRGVSGFGDSGRVHGSDLLDLSLNLPVVVEFFDTPDKVQQVLRHLPADIDPGHVVCWQAQINSAQE